MNDDNNIMNTDGYKFKLPPYFSGAHILLKQTDFSWETH